MEKKKVSKGKVKGKGKEIKKKLKARAKQGKSVHYTTRSDLVGQGRQTVTPGPPPFMNSGLSTLPPLFQTPRGWGMAASQGIPSDPFAQQRINDPMNIGAGNPPLNPQAQAMFNGLVAREQFLQASDQYQAQVKADALAAQNKKAAAQDQAEQGRAAMKSDAEEELEQDLSGQFARQDIPADMSDEPTSAASSSSSYAEALNLPVNQRRAATRENLPLNSSSSMSGPATPFEQTTLIKTQKRALTEAPYQPRSNVYTQLPRPKVKAKRLLPPLLMPPAPDASDDEFHDAEGPDPDAESERNKARITRRKTGTGKDFDFENGMFD
jgi:hypothetical protein